MKFGCFSLDFRRFPIEVAFNVTAKYGFDGLELWGGRPHAYPYDMDLSETKKIVNLKKKYNLEIPMYTPNAIGMPVRLTSLDSREQADALAYFKKAIEAANMMEIPRMLIVADHPGYTVPRKQSFSRFVENVKELGSFAKQNGIILVIEPLTPMESPLITTADECAQAIEEIGMENIEAMLDVVPPTVANEPFSNYFDRFGSKLQYIHICNTDGKTDAHTRLEDGIIPVHDMIQLFKDYSFEGYVTTELYSENYRDPELFVANTARVLKQIRQAVGI